MNNKFYKLLKKFYDKTNCPIIVNTSFNVRGEPIVCSPENALACFMSTNLDVLVMENFLILKDEQNKKLENIYAREIGPD
jgi:carbamoyltransferase